MKEKVIKVLKVEPHKAPEAVALKNELSALQEAVSIGAEYVGLIEVVWLNEKTCIICNEEAKLINLEPNRRLGRDVLCGVFYVAGQTKDGEFASLPDAEMKKWAERFAEPESISDSEVVKTLVTKFFAL